MLSFTRVARLLLVGSLVSVALLPVVPAQADPPTARERAELEAVRRTTLCCRCQPTSGGNAFIVRFDRYYPNLADKTCQQFVSEGIYNRESQIICPAAEAVIRGAACTEVSDTSACPSLDNAAGPTLCPVAPNANTDSNARARAELAVVRDSTICCNCHTAAGTDLTVRFDRVRSELANTTCQQFIDQNIYSQDSQETICPAAEAALRGAACSPAAESVACPPITNAAGALCNANYIPPSAANLGISEQAGEFRSLKPVLSIPIPGVTFSDATLSNGKVTVPFLAQYIAGIFKFAIGAAALLAAIMVVYGGFRYLLGATMGDIKAGKETIQNAVIGLIVLLCGYVVLRSINPEIVTLRPLSLEYAEPVLAPPGSSVPPPTPTPTPGAGATAPGAGGTAAPAPAASPVRKLPDAVDGLTGSAFALQLLGISDQTAGETVLTAIRTGRFANAVSATPRGSRQLDDDARENAIKTALIAGHYPPFLANFIPVNVTAGTHRATFFVSPDVLSIGRDNDYLRIPMKPRTAQEIADHFHMILPTKRIVEAMMAAPNFTHETMTGHDPYGGSRDHNYLYIRSNQEVQQQRNSHFTTTNGFIGGKKDIIITPTINNLIPDDPTRSCVAPSVYKTLRIAIYGAFFTSGGTQGRTNVHSINYVDYSHGVHLVANQLLVDGQTKTINEVLASPELSPLISDRPIATPTYPLTGPTEVCQAP